MLGFIYEWTDNLTGLKYIGRHEGNPFDGYVGSGTKFLREYIKRPKDFTREILWSTNTSTDDLVTKEEEFLSKILDNELYYGSNRKYYNQVRNSSGYTSIDNPMKNPKIVARMLETRKDTHKSPWQNTVEKYGLEEARRINAKNGNPSKAGKGNFGKNKTEEHKIKIAQNHRGGKPRVNLEETMKVFNEYGLKKGSEFLGIHHSTFKSRVLLAKKNIDI